MEINPILEQDKQKSHLETGLTLSDIESQHLANNNKTHNTMTHINFFTNGTAKRLHNSGGENSQGLSTNSHFLTYPQSLTAEHDKQRRASVAITNSIINATTPQGKTLAGSLRLNQVWKYAACMLMVLFMGIGNVWAADPVENVGTYSTQVISADGTTSTWTFITPGSQVTIPTSPAETEDNDIIFHPGGGSKMKFSSSNGLSWSGNSDGYIYVPAGAAGSISMTVKSASDSRWLQLYVGGEDQGSTKRLWSKEANPATDARGPRTFTFTSSDLTTKGTKTYLHLKDNNTEMKIATFTVTLTTGSYLNGGGSTDPVSEVSISGAATGYATVPVEFTATPDETADAYKWFVDGVEQTGKTSAKFNFTASTPGTYSIVAKARNDYNAENEWIASTAHTYTASKLCGELIKIVQNGQGDGTVSGILTGTKDVKLSSGTSEYDEKTGRKIGSDNYWLGVTNLSAPLRASDVASIFVTTTSANLLLYSDKGVTKIGEKIGGVEQGENQITLNSNATGATAIYLYRVSASTDEQGGGNMNPYVHSLAVTRSCVESTDCEIKSLTINGETITPVGKVYSYEVPATSALTEVAVAYSIHPLATATPASGFTVAVPTASDPANTQTITVVAEDGTHSDTYTVSVSKAAAASDVVTLDALAVTGYTLSPTFDAATLAYNITKAYGAADPTADKVNYTKSEEAQSVDVVYDGTNHKFVVTITAEDNTTTQDYEITINEAKAPKSLSRVLFSNGFDAFIDNTNHTVKAYYLAGTSAPTATTITAGAGTAGELSEGKIRVTGVDDSTVDYIVTLAEVTPNTTAVAEEAAAGEFAGDEAWVKNGLLVYGNAAGYSAGDKWYVNRRLTKGTDPADDQRVIAGWVRSYFFVGNAYKFIMTVGGNNAIKYSVDGGAQVVNEAASVEITLPAGNHMIEIVSNQSSGDCRLSAPKLVERQTTYTVTYTAGEGTGDDVVDAFEYAAGDEVTVLENAFTAPANNKFNGWASPAVTISEGKFEMPASNVVLTAQWKEYFTITYMDGGNTLGTEDVFTDATPKGIAAPSKISYEFAGWVDGEDNPVTIASLSATTTVYAKWTVFDGCVMLKPAKNGETISANAAIAMQEGSFGATMKALTADLAYDANGLLFGSSSSTKAEVTLSSNTLKAGTVITAVIYNGNDDKDRGLSLLTKDGASVANATWTAKVVGTHTETYTVQAGDGLEGTNAFQLKREQNAYLQSIKITNCGAEPVTVTFKSADETLIAEKVIEKGTKVEAPAAPHVSGERFLGWSETKNDAESLVNLTTTDIDADVTYYAVYEDVVCPTEGTLFSLAFEATATTGDGVEYTVNKNNDDVQIPAAIATISNGGQAFFGTTNNGDVKILVKNGETAFRANNSNNYIKLIFECPLQVGDVIKFTSSNTRELNFYKDDVSGNAVASSSQRIIITNTEHELFNADVIYIKGGNSACSVKTISISRPYTISFNLQGHGDAIAAQKLIAGDKVVEPTAPTSEGFDFGGWYKESGCTNAWDFDDDVVANTTTLFAKWTEHVTNDATLKSLLYGTKEIDLVAGVYEYYVELPASTTEVPALSGTASSALATSVTVDDADGFTERAATSTITVVAEDGTTTQVYTVHFTLAEPLPQTIVTGSTTWDWSKSGVTSELSKVSVETVFANIEGIKNDENFNSQALSGTADKFQPTYYQGKDLSFRTNKEGVLVVEFSSNKEANKILYVNGNEIAQSATKDHVTTELVYVPAGEVAITASDLVRIYNMTFTVRDEVATTYADKKKNKLTGIDELRYGEIGTFCIEKDVVAYEGVTFYALAGGLGTTGHPTMLLFSEVSHLEAGKPYIYVLEGATFSIIEGAVSVTEPGTYNGFYGSFDGINRDGSEPTAMTGYFVVSNNTIQLCGNNCKVGKHRGYFDIYGNKGAAVPCYSTKEACYDAFENPGGGAAPAPRKRVALNNTAANQATALDNVEEGYGQGPSDQRLSAKEGCYDVLGRRVAEPQQNGVYILNGKKLIIVK